MSEKRQDSQLAKAEKMFEFQTSPEKYDFRNPVFEDPIVRCTDCSRVVKVELLRKLGNCPHCGCRKVKNVLVMSDEEKLWCEVQGVDPEFLKLFEAVDEDTGERINE